MNKIVNMNIVPKELFKKWLSITHQFHKLKPKEEAILALFLYHHYKLKHEITNSKVLWKILFDYDTKNEIKNELNIKDQTMQNALTVFRKKNIVIDNTISPVFIPEVTKKDNNFKIIFNFNIIHE
jgi:hypothetical protein